ncbi:MAG TPA: excinuclease ABC subunit UvrA [Candidatus Kapabacteria bacterium]|nr:excinuclease ABC subunit UvrA [Candidatus Kapabacteria bacterium]
MKDRSERSRKSDAKKPRATNATSAVKGTKKAAPKAPESAPKAPESAPKAAAKRKASPKTAESAPKGAAKRKASPKAAVTQGRHAVSADVVDASRGINGAATLPASDNGAASSGIFRMPEASPKNTLTIRGANVHNLKNVSIALPRNRMIVVSGVSGSGKSSLAFDTIYAEGQRRYVESLSAYARQFLSRMAKPDVESITGLAPAIAIEQKTITKNPRSTVGTTAEVYDYLRLLFARIGQTICKACGEPVRKDTPRTVQEAMKELEDGTRFYVLFPMHAHEKRSLKEELANLREQGFFRVVIGEGSEVVDLNEREPEGIAKSDVFVLVDRVVFRNDPDVLTRIADSAETAFREGEGRAVIHLLETNQRRHFSTRFECANDGIKYEEPQPKLFSFNNPFGACPECQGFGKAIGIDMDLVIPDRTKTLRGGAIIAYSTPKHSEHYRRITAIAKEANLDLDKPVSQLSQYEWNVVIHGYGKYPGVVGFFKEIEEHAYKMHNRVFLSRFRGYTTCPRCKGSRLRTSAMRVFIHGKSIPDLVAMTIEEAYAWIGALVLTPYEEQVANRIMEEITKRLRYLNEVGLGYLRLDRLSHTLSGGESQRINLATSIGSALVGAMYVLDEPSIGLHPRDTDRLVRILKSLRDLGNTVIVVEHDPDIIRNADVIVDMGPHAGEHGGQVVFNGSVEEVLDDPHSLTGAYLSGRKSIPVRTTRRKPGPRRISVRGASEHNLKEIDVDFPLDMLTVVTGVSGSGKSTLVHDVLYPAVARAKGATVALTRKVGSIDGVDLVGAVELVDQSPIGRSPRSNPVTYVKAFDAIRELFALTPVAKVNGWKPGYFSFNVPGGRCEACQGEGVVKVEMQFLADIALTCEVCKGKRFKPETLQAVYRGKNVVDVLEMTVEEAIDFFAKEKKVVGKLAGLRDVGLGYIRLGQPATTLSGGEAQRVKLAAQLVTPADERTLFILDEPTTGLHFDDIATLLKAFNALIDAGHSLVVIEHNLDVIRSADWIIDLGPEGGDAGGNLVCAGTPEHVAGCSGSYTGRFLKELARR